MTAERVGESYPIDLYSFFDVARLLQQSVYN